jgi:hypothetical protein
MPLGYKLEAGCSRLFLVALTESPRTVEASHGPPWLALAALGDSNLTGADLPTSHASHSRGGTGMLPGRTRLGGVWRAEPQVADGYPTIFRIRNSATVLACIPSNYS